MKVVHHSICWIECGPQPSWIGYCPSKIAWDRFMKKEGIEVRYPGNDAAGMTTRIILPNSKRVILITFNDDTGEKPLHVFAGTVAYEATHAFQMICEGMGEEAAGEEHAAYTVQWIAQETWRAYELARKKGKSKEQK